MNYIPQISIGVVGFGMNGQISCCGFTSMQFVETPYISILYLFHPYHLAVDRATKSLLLHLSAPHSPSEIEQDSTMATAPQPA
jgi:hypothetical protein